MAAVLGGSVPAWAEDLRDLSTDRPDTTESPFTVNAGHVQIESDLATAAFDDDTREASVLTLNMKLGITRWLDMQVMIEPHHWVRTDEMTKSGFGDTTVRAKFNLWGNDGGTTAACLMPFITMPTATGGIGAGGVEAGLIYVLGVELPAGISAATMVEGDMVRDDAGSLTPALLLTATAGHDLIGPLGGFAEVALGIQSGETTPEAHGGVTYAIGANAQLDAGVNVGLSGAHTIAPFIGAAWRR